jgi:hypothetical protein
MKKLLLVIAGIALAFSSYGQAWTWASSGGGRSNSDGFTAIDRDASGNTYICGEFEGTKTFGGTSYTAVGFADVFLSKFNSSGAHQWTLQISGTTGTSVVEAGGVTVDGAGNVYLAGNFSFTVSLGGNTFTNAAGNNDAYIVKFNPTGGFIWAKHLAGNGNERITTVKNNGTSIYFAGSYSAALTFGTVSLAAPSASSDDAFLIKMDSAGTAAWGVKGGGAGEDRAFGLSVSSSIIYWAGYFNAVANFGGTNVTAGGGSSDMFIVKLDAAGTQAWVKDFGGNFGEQVNSVSQDIWGNALCLGNFYGTVSFGTGMILTEFSPGNPAGNGDAFICKLEGSTGTCQWVRHIRCTVADNNEVGASISTDPGGSSYITGSFNATTTFANASNQTGTTLTATSNPGKDVYVAKYNMNGGLLWVIKLGGTSNDWGKAIVWNPSGYCTVAGNFSGTVTVSTAPAISISAAPGSASFFIANYNGLTTGLQTINNTLSFDVFPNPADDMIRINTPGNEAIEKIEIYSVNGTLVSSDKIGFNTTELNYNIEQLTPGMYFVHVTTATETGVRKIQIK